METKTHTHTHVINLREIAQFIFDFLFVLVSQQFTLFYFSFIFPHFWATSSCIFLMVAFFLSILLFFIFSFHSILNRAHYSTQELWRCHNRWPRHCDRFSFAEHFNMRSNPVERKKSQSSICLPGWLKNSLMSWGKCLNAVAVGHRIH